MQVWATATAVFQAYTCSIWAVALFQSTLAGFGLHLCFRISLQVWVTAAFQENTCRYLCYSLYQNILAGFQPQLCLGIYLYSRYLCNIFALEYPYMFLAKIVFQSPFCFCTIVVSQNIRIAVVFLCSDNVIIKQLNTALKRTANASSSVFTCKFQ